MKQFILPLVDELVVDLFAGGGGASTGIEQALGRHVDIAVNHDADAIAMHAENHPQTTHYQTDVFDLEPLDVTQGRPVGLLWASPDCKHFSKAKGGKPVSKKIRSLAWVVVKWAASIKPRIIFLENVEEFQTWGPLGPDGRPCPKRKGLTFRRWVRELERLGYVVEWRELRACDYGAPTSRKRLFLVARCDGEPIVWPNATHGPGLRPYLTAADCIDWSIPAPSIFERDRPLAENTLRRIARGIMKYVVNSADPFIVPVTHPSDARVQSIRQPLRTITSAQRGEFAVAVPRIAAFLAKHYGGNETPGSALAEPVHTITTQDHNALVTSNLVKLRGTSSAAAANEPLHTISAQGTHHAEVRALLIKFYGTDQDPRLADPLHTITTKDRFALVLVKGEPYAIVDIGMRMLEPRELYRAQGFPDGYVFEQAGGRPLPKHAQVRMCGNSVCPPLARALVAANMAESAYVRRAA